MNKKLISLKISFLGDKLSGKSTFISNYVNYSKSIQNKKEKDSSVSFIKELDPSNQFKITINEYNEKNDKYISSFAESHCIFIMFEMSSRKSLENLLDYWLIFLRDSCHYKGQVVIFGNHINKNESLMTDEQEIGELIEVSDVNCKFYNIANKEKEQNNELIDSLIKEAYEIARNTKYDKKDCSIY